MSVIDASAVVELILCSDVGLSIAALLGHEGGGDAPELVTAEALSGLRNVERRGELDDQIGETLMESLDWLPLRRHPHQPLLATAWSLRHDVTASDALYVALARHLGTGLVTTDSRLARAPNLGIPVTVVT
jgi:predicted nucleic acid-binding protein